MEKISHCSYDDGEEERSRWMISDVECSKNAMLAIEHTSKSAKMDFFRRTKSAPTRGNGRRTFESMGGVLTAIISCIEYSFMSIESTDQGKHFL